MSAIQGKFSFYLSAFIYFLFNLRIGNNLQDTMIATLWQLLQTAPFVAGLTYLIISVLQYMGDGSKISWDRRLRLFFAIGIMAGLIYGIWEYGGVDMGQQQLRN